MYRRQRSTVSWSRSIEKRGENRTLELMIDMTLGMLIWILLKGNSVTPMHLKNIESCLEEHGSYCFYGNCIFHTELNMPACRCIPGYSGERCENMMLSSYTQYNYEGYIAVGIGAAMLLIGIFAVIYCYVRKRYKETKSSYKPYHVETAL